MNVCETLFLLFVLKKELILSAITILQEMLNKLRALRSHNCISQQDQLFYRRPTTGCFRHLLIWHYLYVQEVTCTDPTRCIKAPTSCASSQNCDVLISYQHNATEDALIITIATNASHKWVSFTQVPALGSDKMVIDFMAKRWWRFTFACVMHESLTSFLCKKLLCWKFENSALGDTTMFSPMENFG